MPAGFNTCYKNGGKIKTKTMPGGRYMLICYIGGKSYPGEIKKRKNVRRKPKRTS